LHYSKCKSSELARKGFGTFLLQNIIDIKARELAQEESLASVL
jgi:hypothetical protein